MDVNGGTEDSRVKLAGVAEMIEDASSKFCNCGFSLLLQGVTRS